MEHCQSKTYEKNLGGPKLGPKLGQAFCHFLKVHHYIDEPWFVKGCYQTLTSTRGDWFLSS